MAVVYEKGIIVIPKILREKVGLQKGTRIEFEVKDKKLIISPKDEWSSEFEQLCQEFQKSSGKDVEKKLKRAQEKYKNRYKHAH